MSDTNSNVPADSTAPVESSEATTESTSENLSDQPGEAKASAAPVQPNKKKFKFKVDGQEVEEELDLNDEVMIKKHLSMSKAAYKRMQEAAQVKRQNEQFVKMLMQDPIKVLTHPQFGGGKKFRELAERYLAGELENELLTPEQRNQRDREAKLRNYEEQEKQFRQQQEQAQMQKLQDHYAQDFEQKIMRGLSSQGIPKTARTVKRMAELMSKNLQHGLELEPEALAEIVKQDYISEMKEMFGATEGDALLSLLGDDVSNKIRKSDLARLRNPNPTQGFSKSNQPNPTSVQPTPKEPMTKEQWKEWIDKRSKS